MTLVPQSQESQGPSTAKKVDEYCEQKINQQSSSTPHRKMRLENYLVKTIKGLIIAIEPGGGGLDPVLCEFYFS